MLMLPYQFLNVSKKTKTIKTTFFGCMAIFPNIFLMIFFNGASLEAAKYAKNANALKILAIMLAMLAYSFPSTEIPEMD